MRTINRDIVSAHLFSSDGKLFMARNTHQDSGKVVYGDAWKIPGGGVDPAKLRFKL